MLAPRPPLAPLCLALLLAAPATARATAPAEAPAEPAPPPGKGRVKVEFYLMSQCPFAADVVGKIKGVVDQFGDDLDFTIDYIGTLDPQGNPASMHGPNEVQGDIVQLCAMKHAPRKWLSLIACQNRNPREVATNWEECAKEAGLPVDDLRTCLTGSEGKDLLVASFKRAEARSARGSPTMFFNGKPYTGKRNPTAFLKEICGSLSGAVPAQCTDLPVGPKVTVTILSDKRCAKCDTERWANMIKQRVENPVIKLLDYGDAEGKALYDSLGDPTASLPLLLFDQSLDADKDAASLLGRALRPLGNYRTLAAGGQWNPACANKGGCALPQCKEILACRKEVPKKLEVFVMSQCPYAVKALNAMDEVLATFGNKLDFTVHFIGSGSPAEGFSSMHGDGEVKEDIRELCAMKHYRKNFQWMQYVLCRNKDIRSTSWQECAAKGIDVQVIERCAAGDEGAMLLDDDLKIGRGLGIGASPTWIVNGRTEFNAIDAETIRKNFCEANKNAVKGCEKTLGGVPNSGSCGH